MEAWWLKGWKARVKVGEKDFRTHGTGLRAIPISGCLESLVTVKRGYSTIYGNGVITIASY